MSTTTDYQRQLNLIWTRGNKTIQERFEEYHHENPRVFELVVRFARQARDAGHATYGIKSIWERVRWHMSIETQDPDGWKLNNNYTSRYARLVMDECPDLDGFFNTRELQSP